MKRSLLLVILVAVLYLMGTTIAGEEVFKYVGVQKCKMCHKTAKSGDQYDKWQQSKHAKAYETLATAEAKAVAKKIGLAGDPQQAKECLVCHTTAFDAPVDQKMETLTLTEGVSCEACHGPGSGYKSMKVMKAIYAGTDKGEAYGLIAPTKEVCVTCHNTKSPTFKEFDFDKAIKIIAHPVPAK